MSKFDLYNKRFEESLATFTQFYKDDNWKTKDKKAERLKRCAGDPLEFAKEYFPLLFDRPYNDVQHWMADLKPGKYGCNAFRFGGKTAFAYIMFIIMPLCRGDKGVVNLNALTDTIAKQNGRKIMRLMKKNPKLCYDFDITVDQDLTGYWIVNNTPFITGSYKTGLRSVSDDNLERITWQLNDDLYGVDEAVSELQCERIYNFVTDEAWGQLDQDNDFYSMFLGNSINAQSPIVQFKEEFPNNYFELPALVDADGNADDAGESSWPEFRSRDEWLEFKAETPWDVWESQYMLRPAIKGDIFSPEWFRGINTSTISFLTTIAVTDPARGQSPSACDKAFGVGSITSSRELVLRDLYVRKESYWQFFEYAWESLQRYDYAPLLFEDDFAQWQQAEPYYKMWSERTGKRLPIHKFLASDLATEFRSAHKDDRFWVLVHPMQTGGIYFDDKLLNTPDYKKLQTQALSLGRVKDNVDGPDMLASLYILAFRYIKTGSFKASKKRSWRKKLFGGGL